MTDDQRLIEDYIPIEAISEEARREKSIRKGHISTLHLWWARRPLVASRAAVYGALVPAPRNKKEAKAAREFVADLCKYPGSQQVVDKAEQHILAAHAQRLTAERGELVTAEDIREGRAPRPRVLDMFAGGGAIPLEALRLGCEAYALDLNPVAHIIQLCTLVYPQQYGPPDPAAKGSAPDGMWAGLAKEVEYWGQWVIARVRDEIGDLYPPIPDPRPKDAGAAGQLTLDLALKQSRAEYDAGADMLTPVAYLWTRTVQCKNPACGGTVPLVRQTWLAKKNDSNRFTALKASTRMEQADEKTVKYEVVEATTPNGLGFDPTRGSKGGSVACPFCDTVVDNNYVMAEGKSKRLGKQLMAVVFTKLYQRAGKTYLSHQNPALSSLRISDDEILARINRMNTEDLLLSKNPGILEETIRQERPSPNARGLSAVTRYGFTRYSDLFTPRQLLSLLTFVVQTKRAYREMRQLGYDENRAKAITTYLGMLIDRLADYNSSFCSWHNTREVIGHTFARQALSMVWDFVEINPLGDASGNAKTAIEWITDVIETCSDLGQSANVWRGSATQPPFADNFIDAIITDPPYYDNVPYSDLSDFFFVWLKLSIGFLYPQHFSSVLSPKKKEAIMDSGRSQGDVQIAKAFYEETMAKAFIEAARMLKPGGPLVVVYAHKTTIGWATLVDALRTAGFTVTEAWPLDTEMGARIRAIDTASLASSIFLVARRRENSDTGSYENEVLPELRRIVRERVETLWTQGITGADLVIACVGAGLRAFTRYARVEYANGQEVPADSFLTEVEGAVLEGLLAKIFGVNQAGVSQVDGITRFYVLWRYTYRHAAIDAGEAIIFSYPQQVELDGPRGLTGGGNPLVIKQGSNYHLRDFTERGADDNLGLPQSGADAPLIDVLHRLLYLVENRPGQIPAYLDQARPDVERLRVVAQTLAGQTLAGNGSGGGKSLVAARGAEAAALRKLTTNWRTLVEQHRGGLV